MNSRKTWDRGLLLQRAGPLAWKCRAGVCGGSGMGKQTGVYQFVCPLLFTSLPMHKLVCMGKQTGVQGGRGYQVNWGAIRRRHPSGVVCQNHHAVWNNW